MGDTFQTADALRIKHDLDEVEPPVSLLARALINKDNKVILDLTDCRTVSDVRDLLGSGPYTLLDSSSPIVAGGAYAVDTSGETTIPEVLPSAVIGGLRFVGTTQYATEIYVQDGGQTVLADDNEDVFEVLIEPDVSTLQDVIDACDGAASMTVTLADGAVGTDLAITGYDILSGGSPETTQPTPIALTLPSNPTAGQFIDVADARGTWGSNPVTVLRNGQKIEGVETDFVNNASGTFFRLLYVNSDTGWRVLASGARPINLVAPTISGSPFAGAVLAANNGTWTGSPTSFSYQWQASDDAGDTWTNLTGATSQTYSVTSGEEAKIIRVRVSATNANGTSSPVASQPTEEITIPDFPMGGLLAFWKLADLTDASGSGNTLTNNNGVTFGLGKVGDAAEFDGTNHLSRSMSVVPQTISLWCKSAAFGGYRMLFSVMDGSSVTYSIQGTSSGTFRFDVSVEILASTAQVDGGAWHHIVVRLSDGNVEFFVDGVADGDALFDATGLTCDSVGLGSYAFGLYDFLDGQLDAVGVWDRALTNEEIGTLYNGGAGLEPA